MFPLFNLVSVFLLLEVFEGRKKKGMQMNHVFQTKRRTRCDWRSVLYVSSWPPTFVLRREIRTLPTKCTCAASQPALNRELTEGKLSSGENCQGALKKERKKERKKGVKQVGIDVCHLTSLLK